MIVSRAEQQIRERLAKRGAALKGRCASCGHEQDLAPAWQPMASSMATEQSVCQKCRGQIVYTITIGGDEPSADEDLQTLLTLLDTLSQELERLTKPVPDEELGGYFTPSNPKEARMIAGNNRMAQELANAQFALTALREERKQLLKENKELLARRDTEGDSPRQPAAPTDGGYS